MQKAFISTFTLVLLAIAGCKKNCNDTDKPVTIVPGGHANALSVGRSFMASASLDNKAFFAGGFSLAYDSATDSDWSTLYNTVDIYDGETGQWTTAALSESKSILAAAAAGNKVVFAGGQLPNAAATSTADIYDVNTKQWKKDFLSQPRYLLAAAAAGSKIAFGGGNTGFGRSKRVDIYDVNTGQWKMDSLSEPREYLAAAGAGNKILFAGGKGDDGAVTTVDIYDITTDKWTTAALTEPRFLLQAVAVGNKIVIAGGLADNRVSRSIDIYDVTTGQWTSKSLTYPIYYFSSAALGNTVMLAGGAIRNSADAINTIELFDASTNTSSTAPFLLKEPTVGAAAASLGNKLLVAGGFKLITGQGNSRVYHNHTTVNFFELK